MTYDSFSQLGARLLGEKPSDLDTAIKSLEHFFPISDRYREMLLAFGGAIVFDNGAKFMSDEQSPLNDKEGYQSLDILYGLSGDKNSIEHKADQFAGELPISFVPIGEASGGNLICVNHRGSVYLWDHESLREHGGWHIAPSVDEFMERLVPDDSDIGSTDGIIESESFLDF